jgi:hypothetical protein
MDIQEVGKPPKKLQSSQKGKSMRNARPQTSDKIRTVGKQKHVNEVGRRVQSLGEYQYKMPLIKAK